MIPTISSEMIRILNLATQLETGGAQTVALTLHRHFKMRGLQSKMVFLYEKDGRAFPQRDFETLSKTKPFDLLGLLKLLSSLISTWRNFAPTHIVAHTYYSFIVAGFLARFGLGGKVIVVHHNVASFYPKHVTKLDRLLGAIGAYHNIVAVSDAAARTFTYYSKSLQQKIITITNAQCSYPSVLTPNQARNRFNFPPTVFIVGTVGRLSEQKNQSFLIDVASKIPALHVFILGEGHLRNALENQIDQLNLSGRVKLLGNMVHEEAAHFLRALDVFALPSLHEGRSIALLEAMGTGLSIVATDVPTIANDLKTSKGENAGIVLPLDIQSWVESLKYLKRHKKVRIAMGKKAMELVSTPSIDMMVDHYLSCF